MACCRRDASKGKESTHKRALCERGPSGWARETEIGLEIVDVDPDDHQWLTRFFGCFRRMNLQGRAGQIQTENWRYTSSATDGKPSMPESHIAQKRNYARKKMPQASYEQGRLVQDHRKEK
jgi:hypothetical protein